MKTKQWRWLRRSFAVIACVIVVFVWLLYDADRRLRPVLREYAVVQAQTAVGEAVNCAVGGVILGGATDFLKLSCAADGRVLSVGIDTAALNCTKIAVTEAVLAALKRCERLPVSVPAGSVYGSSWLTGRGPLLHFPVHMSCSASVMLESCFEEAGINQTQYALQIVIVADAVLLLPDGTKTLCMEQTSEVVQTVLLGEVPRVYFGNGQNKELQRILGYTDIQE